MSLSAEPGASAALRRPATSPARHDLPRALERAALIKKGWAPLHPSPPNCKDGNPFPLELSNMQSAVLRTVTDQSFPTHPLVVLMALFNTLIASFAVVGRVLYSAELGWWGPSCTQLLVRSFTHSCVDTERFHRRRRFTGSWTHRTQRCGRRLARADRGVVVPGGAATRTTAVPVRGPLVEAGTKERERGGEG